MVEIKYDVVEKLGVISESAKGWTKELNLISWNGKDPKYDIREWAPNGDKMAKGITFTRQDIIKLREIINGLVLEESDISMDM